MLGGDGPAAVPGWPRGVVCGVLLAVAALALRAGKLVVHSGTHIYILTFDFQALHYDIGLA